MLVIGALSGSTGIHRTQGIRRRIHIRHMKNNDKQS